MDRHVSPSQIKTAGNCLRQWWVERVEGKKQGAGDAAKRGTAFGDQLGDIYSVAPHPDSPSAKHKEEIIGPHIVSEARDMARYYVEQPRGWSSADEAEVPCAISPKRWRQLAEYYDLAIGRVFPLIGYADFIRRTPCLELLENKTSGRAQFRAEWVTQTHIYAIVLEAVEAWIHLVATSKSGYRFLAYKVPLDKKALGATVARCLRIMDQIGLALETEGETVYEQPGYYCSYCPVNLDCASYRCANLAAIED